MKRIFVAVLISKELQGEIFAWEQNFKSNPNSPIRWVEPKNLHVTLVPPFGDASGLRPIIDSLKTVKAESFNIRFESISFGPDRNRPRMIWATGQALQKIEDLRYKIYGALGREPEKRPFRLHATLARFKPEDFAGFPIKNFDEKTDWRQKVDSFVLMESHLSAQGADYEILEKFELSDKA